jgi:hypothetical protein
MVRSRYQRALLRVTKNLLTRPSIMIRMDTLKASLQSV